ncbi:zinc finger protein 436-like [Wyeomyia smithii]|uniref:zinc finger protein 436-like n=1 Tax=Wyeomyia smithii TaxID=174621 RepID=UPI002467ECFD|nr:zinc finger protein 436-like [Wyeomyia smithii]XP_055532613.1 zinc finger protein 436-like [Wyeomyia smithii]
MVRKCCVPGCNSNYDAVLRYSMSPISTFKFPDDPEHRNRWVRAVRRQEGWKPGRTACICIHHFKPEDILKYDKPAKLKPDAVPSVFGSSQTKADGLVIKRGRPKKVAAKGPFIDSESNDQLHTNDERENGERDLMEELILDFGDFLSRIEKTDCFDGWHHYQHDKVLHFYSISDENKDKAIRIENSVKVFEDMTMYLFLKETKQADECLQWILGHELKVRRWSQFDNILKKYRYASTSDKREDSKPSQIERLDNAEYIDNENDSFEQELEITIENENNDNFKIVDIAIEKQATSREPIEFLSIDASQTNSYDCISLSKNPLNTNKGRILTQNDNCERRHVRDTIRTLKLAKNKCFICDLEHESIEEFEHHLPSHISMIPYKCQRCVSQDVTLTTLASLNKHFLMHLKPLKCRTCDVRFSSYGTRLLHEENSHSNRGPISCEVCGKVLRSLRGYQHHVKVHSNPEAVKCQVCEKQLSSSYELKLHLRVHTKEKPNKCPFCTASFNRVSNLVAHKRRFHSKEKPFVCLFCDDRFRTSVELKRHSSCHNPESSDNVAEKQNRRLTIVDSQKLYHCKVCDKRLPTRTSYHSHMRQHRKRFQCSFCGLQIGQRRDFIDHENTHTGARPYECEICSKRFQTSSTYYGHRAIHSGVKRFACDNCDRRFTRLNHLIVHKKTHSAPKAKSGSRSCRNRETFTKHLKSHEDQQGRGSVDEIKQAQSTVTIQTVSEAIPCTAIQQSNATTEQVQQLIRTVDGREAILLSADVIIPNNIIILQQQCVETEVES